MATTIDKGSITARVIGVNVYLIGFDFTDDAVVDPLQGWLNTWKHAEFVYNQNQSQAEFEANANIAMEKARKPATESNLETTLKNAYGTAIVRVNPTVVVPNDGRDADHPLYVRVVT